MNAAAKIRDLVKADLADNHNIEPVRFMDELLCLASEVGEISCTLANAGALRFQIPDELDCDVELGRAKSKLRILCARLAVLCHESGCPEVSIYGGEGVIKSDVRYMTSRMLSAAASSSVSAAVGSGGSLDHQPEPDAHQALCQERPVGWFVRFENTMSRQTFTIHKANE